MIVQPDFLDHWKTQMFSDALGDPCAPLMILRLWAHCQQRRTGRFPGLTAAALKAICRAGIHDAMALQGALLESGFVHLEGNILVVHQWEEQNASLFKSWENGKKGGRPPKEPKQNPRVTTGQPTGNPAVTRQEPIREEKSREDEIRVEIPEAKASEKENRARATPKQMSDYCLGHQLLVTDGEWIHDKMLSQGWKVDGKPVKDWQALIRVWKRSEYFPSQKTPKLQHNGYTRKPAESFPKPEPGGEW